jgi:hypothetical protein
MGRGFMRRRIRSRRLDTSDLRNLVRDRRRWSAIGIVIVPEGESSHFDLDGEDLLVEVEIQPDGLDVSCRVGSAFGGPGLGMWAVPPVGSEVLIALPDGRLDFQPTIVGVLSTGQLPQGVAENVTVIANGTVLITDGGDPSGAEPLIKKSEFDNHIHPSGMGPTEKPLPATGTNPLKAT